MKKFVTFLIWIIWVLFITGSGRAQEPLQVLTPKLPAAVTHQLGGEDKLIVSVRDQDDNPVKGLGLEDFIIKRGRREAKLISVETLETSEDVGLNVILVLDNSSSMKMRDAVGPLLSALDEFLKIVRPIDNIHAVVFDPTGSTSREGRTLHERAIRSQDATQLKRFFKESFNRGLSIKTFLYEGILTALDIARKMPPKQNKLVVIFSDGEDINSSYGPSVVTAEAKKVENLQVFAIDYMPGTKKDPFLKSLAEAYDGHIWKAVSANELVPIFKAFSTALRHQYVIAYQFLKPPEGRVDMFPGRLDLDVLTLQDGTPVPGFVFFETGRSVIPPWYVSLSDPDRVRTFDPATLKDALERYRNVLNIIGKRLRENPEAAIRVTGFSGVGIEKDNISLATKRVESVKAYLSNVWGVDESRMIREGESAEERPIADSSGLLGAESRRVVIEFLDPAMQRVLNGEFITESTGATEITVRPLVVSDYGIARWALTIDGDGRPLLSKEQEGELKLIDEISLDALDKGALMAVSGLKASLEVVDNFGDHFTTETSMRPVNVTTRNVLDALIPPLQGTLVMAPKAVAIEEVTLIDTSPMLNYIFFEENNSEIPDRYTLSTSQKEAEQFDETQLKGALEKYARLLDIVGKRLSRTPEAKITLVGCNANYGAEKGRTELSRSRAEAVRGYLKYLWDIDFSRMEVRAQNLPQVPSTNRIPEGRAENQRVEIYSDTPDILDTTRSIYIEEMSDVETLSVEIGMQAGFGVKQWKLDLKGDGAIIHSITGSHHPDAVYPFKLKDLGLKRLSGVRNLSADMEVMDERGQVLNVSTKSSIPVTFIKREERLSQKMGYRVVEKYALILFDYDSAKIKGRNEAILERIIARVKELPNASVRIVGHTDTIGDESYNMKLSERRARAVYDAITTAGLEVNADVTFSGVGPHDSPYDNTLPEGRSFNRTVIIHLEYDKRD